MVRPGAEHEALIIVTSTATTTASADPSWFRDAMANVASTVTVITALDGDQPRGATVSAFMSLSLHPPMVLVALARTSNVLAAIQAAGTFGVNVLGSDQADLAARFAYLASDQKFAGLDWTLTGGLPRLPAVPGWVACDVARIVAGGDHLIVLGAVRDADTVASRAPLTYHQRTFGTHLPASTGPDSLFDLWT
jgi:flavin reductase (DIM6/NTAB) family NADH-FMN oxidoreductase RutF